MATFAGGVSETAREAATIRPMPPSLNEAAALMAAAVAIDLINIRRVNMVSGPPGVRGGRKLKLNRVRRFYHNPRPFHLNKSFSGARTNSRPDAARRS